MRTKAFPIGLILTNLLLTPVPSFAHITFAGAGDFYSGVLHPVTVPAHILILTGLGLLFSQGTARRLNGALPSFFTAFIAGLTIASFTGITELPKTLMSVCAAGIGILVAAERPLPRMADHIIAGLPAFLIGLDSAPGPNTLKTTLLMTAGTLLGAHILIVGTAVYGRIPQRPWMRIGIRVLGSWIAAGSIMFAALAFRM